MVAILEKSDAAQGFEQIIDFLSGSYIHHALTVNPHVYISCIKQFWNTAVVKHSGDVTRVGKGFSGVETPHFENMLAVRAVNAKEEVQEIATEVVQPTPTSPSPSSPVLDKCSVLVLRVEGLETTSAAQQLEIIKLKARVKKLERLNKVKSSKLKHLKKVGTSQRIESLEDEENVFNQGRISVDMDQDEGVELVVDQEKDAQVKGRQADTQAEIYNIDLDHSSKVLSMLEDTKVQEAVEVVTTAKLITKVVTAAATQVAAASAPILAAKPKVLKIFAEPAVSTRKRKGVVIRYPEEELHDDTPAETPWFKMEFFKGKTYDQILPIFQARFDANMKFLFKSREEMEKENEEIIKSINETPAQKATKRRKLSEEAQEADNRRGHLEIVPEEDDDVFVEAIPLAQKALNFDREDLESLWRIVKDRFSTKKPNNFSDEYLLLTLKKMFGELDEQDAIWRNQKSVHGLALEAKLNANINWNDVIEKVKRSKRLTDAVMKYQALMRKPLTEAQARRNMIVYFKNMAGYKMDYFKNQSPRARSKARKKVKVESPKREGESLEQEIIKNQKMEQEIEELKKHLEIIPDDDDDVYTDATPLASKISIFDYKIHTKRNKPYIKIIRADGNQRLFLSFSTMMKIFYREYLESLWKIDRERFEKTEPENYSDDYLLNTLKIMFEKPNIEANIFLLVERMYPLTHFTLEQMINDVRLEVEDESEMSLELLRLKAS
nr:hypothetical protein [Tanacetum cinerariifolium]